MKNGPALGASIVTYPPPAKSARFPSITFDRDPAGGESTLDNLALACPHCNGRKWASTESVDQVTGVVVSLFNPRLDRWDDHFEWSSGEPLVILGRTPTGRATVALLELNHP